VHSSGGALLYNFSRNAAKLWLTSWEGNADRTPSLCVAEVGEHCELRLALIGTMQKTELWVTQFLFGSLSPCGAGQ